MATQDPTPLPNAAELTPQQIADQIAAQTTGGEPPEDQRGYVYHTETGSVFQGRTKQEVIDKLLKSVEHGSRKIKEQDDELGQYRAQLEQQPPYVQQPPERQQQETWTPQRYYEMWAQDPDAAEDYRLRVKHGINLAQFAYEHQHAYEFARRVEPHVIATSWMSTAPSYPDFQRATPEEAEKAASAIGTLWNEFYPNQDESTITPQRLEQLHAVALMRGLYQPAQAQPVETPAQPSPMPTLNVGTSATTGPQDQINSASPEQIRAWIEQNYNR